MIGKVKVINQVAKNMGWRYVAYRGLYEFKKKSGLLKKAFPIAEPINSFINLEDWRMQAPPFFFAEKAALNFQKKRHPKLEEQFNNFVDKGILTYFQSTPYEIGKDYNWLKNPDSGHVYQLVHWTEIQDLSKEAGDIKYVWEKSRFSFLYTLIRHDYHFEKDNGELVFKEIDSWIKSNPINKGPNFICSQEISIRIINWTFALYYYKNNPALTEERFDKIIATIYAQLEHVYNNINFSRITVRNNHAITETLMLYLGGLLFPFFDKANLWKTKGKKWFEEEIAYQVYEDGTYLQYSHNYQRVVLQLMTWAFYLASANGESFTETTYQRAKASINYLKQCCEQSSGFLPHMGPDDGALFFKLNEGHHRDYRPQLNALYYFFNRKFLYEQSDFLKEDVLWLSNNLNEKENGKETFDESQIQSFDLGGIATIREKDIFTFIRNCKHQHRPSHADNLHLDIWYKGINILRDSGTYKYNTEQKYINHFNGTSAHNTIGIGEEDQMKKGPRFIWLSWSKGLDQQIKQEAEHYVYNGSAEVYKQMGEGIIHHRTVRKIKGKAEWEIVDDLQHETGKEINQYWNPSGEFEDLFTIEAEDEDGPIKAKKLKSWYSPLYGKIEEAHTICFTSKHKRIKTRIRLK